MKIAPIPAYLVWDRFDKDLDATMVYERLMYCQHDSEMRTHVVTFLWSCMVGCWRDNDEKPFLPAEVFYNMLPPEAHIWGMKRFTQLLTTLGQPAPPALPPRAAGGGQPQAAAAATATGTQGPGIIQMDAVTLRQFLQAAPLAGAAAVVTPEAKKEDDTFKVSDGKKAWMKRMCGLDDLVGNECLPR